MSDASKPTVENEQAAALGVTPEALRASLAVFEQPRGEIVAKLVEATDCGKRQCSPSRSNGSAVAPSGANGERVPAKMPEPASGTPTASLRGNSSPASNGAAKLPDGVAWTADTWEAEFAEQVFGAGLRNERARRKELRRASRAFWAGREDAPGVDYIKAVDKRAWKDGREAAGQLIADNAGAEDVDLQPGKLDEAAAADAFTLEHGARFAFDPRRGIWREFHGGIWREVKGRAVGAMREIAPQLRRRNTVHGALGLAGATLEVWDWNRAGYLACEGGHIDLSTGELIPREAPEIFHTRVVPVPADGVPEEWTAFVFHGLLRKYRTLAERREVARWLQAWCYAAISGQLPKYEKFLFLQGPRGSGKSTFTDTLRVVFGEHASPVSGDRLASDARAHRSWLAVLADKRLIVAPEIPNRRASWQSADLSALVSGEALQVNFMRQNPFSMHFAGGLIVLGNKRPAGAPESGIWRRMVLVETVQVRDVDTDLKERLAGNAGGVLRWVLDGREHLDALRSLPDALVSAVEDYREGEDILGQWLHERCEVGRNCTEKSKVLLADHNEWRERNELRKLSVTAFGRALTERGFGKRESGVIWRDGLQVRKSEPD